MPNPEFVLAAQKVKISVRLEPALNAFNSLMTIYKAQHLSGMSEWSNRTLEALPEDIRRQHNVVASGLYYAIEPPRSFRSFEAYLGYLAQTDPARMRDRLLEKYVTLFCGKATAIPPEPQSLLESLDAYLGFLRGSEAVYDEESEIEAFRLLHHLPEMHATILDHLRYMWETTLADEWERVRPMLQESVDAFAEISLSGLAPNEAYYRMTGLEADENMLWKTENAREFTFVPSAHIGPYTMKINTGERVWLFFGAQMPHGSARRSPELSIAELKVRLDALADDTRLQILTLIAERGELCTTDIMELLDLPQSTAQRHLKQLSATGYLIERRVEGAKCFSINQERIDDTFTSFRRLVQ
jgi:DNA-binding transcriptional ArsR family regulator